MHAVQRLETQEKRERETIHSGQFMVSTFEAEEQDDEDEVAVPIPEVAEANTSVVQVKTLLEQNFTRQQQQQLSIDTSLAKLFQCMSLAYRQKLTSPKWNRFRGIRLRWKDKIRLNNVIWRCWHLQFIKKENTLICQFASPLDVDTHNKPEAVVLEGKYWKRKLAAVTAEYKKWRLFYRNHALGQTVKDDVEMLGDIDLLPWNSQSSENMHMMVDEDYMGLMSDTLFSTITNQPFVFPDSREIAKAGLADFIQPSLGPLQPNLDDYMDLEPFQEFITSKLPTVPEEHNQSASWSYPELDILGSGSNVTISPIQSVVAQYQPPQINLDKQVPNSSRTPAENIYNAAIQTNYNQFVSQEPSYHSTVISKNAKPQKKLPPHVIQNQIPTPSYNKQVFFTTQNLNSNICLSDRISMPIQDQISQPQIAQQQYKIAQQAEQNHAAGYTFAEPVVPNLKFTSQVACIMHPIHPTNPQYTSSNHSFSQKEEKDLRAKGAPRIRQRSRSNTREPVKRPPLLSAASDTNLFAQFLNPEPEQVFSRSQSLISSHDQIQKHIRIKDETSLSIHSQNQSNPTTLIITTKQPNVSAVQSTSCDSLILNSFSSSNSPVLDTSQNIHSPTSSQGSIGSPNRDRGDQRRVGHIHAEQKRRYNIKNGFDTIHALIPQLNQNPNSRLSKAAMLQKGADYIRQLRSERNQLNDEMESLRQQIETLNTSISNCQSMLPATGAPVSRRRDSKMKEMFDEYVKKRTMENWKYWIFSLLFRPLLDSFNNFVSTSSLDDLYSSTILWIEQHCSLVDLRPVVLNSLKYLSTKTDILSEPDRLPDEVRQMVLQRSSQ